MVTDLSHAEWRKAALSHGGGCVEIAGSVPGVTGIRDSTAPGRGALTAGRASFAAFPGDARQGRCSL